MESTRSYGFAQNVSLNQDFLCKASAGMKSETSWGLFLPASITHKRWASERNKNVISKEPTR